MATTTITSRSIDPKASVGLALVGIALAVAALATAVPLAGRGDAAPIETGPFGSASRPDPCLNILTCGRDDLHPGKVDPGLPRRTPALPSPQVVVPRVEAVGTSSGQYLQVHVEVTNWEAYHPTLFQRGSHDPACGGFSNPSRTRVDILDGEGGVLDQYCSSTPRGLASFTPNVANGSPIPERIAVRLVDSATDRVVVSRPIVVPQQISRVRTRYGEAEVAHLEFAADFWKVEVWEVQQAGVMAIRYIHGVAGTTGSKPLRPRPAMAGRGETYASDWATEQLHALEWVSEYHDLTYAETQKLGALVMIYVAVVAPEAARPPRT